MPGYATIKLTTDTLGSVLASLSDTPGGEARFMHACLRYPYKEGEDVYFVRGNFKNKSGLHDFDDHLFTESQLNEIFDWTSSDGKQRAYASKPNGYWFTVFLKGTQQIDTLYDEEGVVVKRIPRGDLQAFLKRTGGRYLSCTVHPHGSDRTISVRKYKGEFNGEQADKALEAAKQSERPEQVH